MVAGYYEEQLSANRLKQCYDLAHGKIEAYLNAELAFARAQIHPGDRVLELGCGYGRVIEALVDSEATFVGIDTSRSSLSLAEARLGSECEFAQMDASRLELESGSFDVVLCLQNGLSAFGVAPELLVENALRVTRPGGRIVFGSYAPSLWPERLAWFEAQSKQGLIGPIDAEKTGDGVIVCTDGFRATTTSPKEFKLLAHRTDAQAELVETEGALLCLFNKPNETAK